MNTPPRPELWLRLAETLGATLGLHYPPERHNDLVRCFHGAMREWGFDDAQTCLNWLLREAPTPTVVQVLAHHFTVGETYFFRDQPMLDALAGDILPALIRARRGNRQQLRLWCAACCTGEEAYTLAILLHRLLPDLAEWDVTVLATDVNSRFLEKAAAGRYGEWSFRSAPVWLRPRYFERDAHGGYTVLPEIKRMVKFSPLNLVTGAPGFARADVQAMDIVFCRNVLMYFRAPEVRKVVDGLWHCLVDEGWLVLAPSEVSSATGARFRTALFPGAIALRKSASPLRAAAPALRSPPANPAPAPITAARAAPPSDAAIPACTAALAAHARECANLGRLTEARDWCDRWLAVDRLDPLAHYVRAVVLLEQGDTAAAKVQLQSAVYLDGSFVMAHFALGHLALRAGHQAQAHRHYENTRRLLEPYGPGDEVAEAGELTAGQLVEALQALAPFELTP